MRLQTRPPLLTYYLHTYFNRSSGLRLTALSDGRP